MPLTSEQRDFLYLGLGGALVVGVFAFVGQARARQRRAPASGVQFNHDCSDWRIFDATKLEATLKTVYGQETAKGERDPWSIVSRQLARIAPQCRRPPAEPRTVGEALLIYNLYKDNVDQMLMDDLISDVEAQGLHAGGVLWAGLYNVPKEHIHGQE